jgi:hypothetical protein
MPENVNNRTTGEKILIGFLILVGVVTLFVGSYAIGKSIKVARNSATTTVSAQDVERISKAIVSRLDSIDRKDSLQNEILTEIMSSIESTNKELKQIDKHLNRIEKMR